MPALEPAQPPSEFAIPLAVAEAERWRYDLDATRVGSLMLAAAVEIGMPEQPLATTVPVGLTAKEFAAMSLLSQGETRAAMYEALEISERALYTHIANASARVGTRTAPHAVRRFVEIGLLVPDAPRAGEHISRLSLNEFLVLSLSSRGWTTKNMTGRMGVSESTVNTQKKGIYRKLHTTGIEHSVRRAMGIGSLVADMTLIGEHRSRQW